MDYVEVESKTLSSPSLFPSRTHLLEVADELVDEPFTLDLADHVAVVVVPGSKVKYLVNLKSLILQNITLLCKQAMNWKINNNILKTQLL